jgi:F-type H+-transporting ATPase subunit b
VSLSTAVAALPAVLAAEPAQHPNPILPSPNEIVFGLISFLVVLAFLVKYALPRMQEALAARTAAIEGKMEQAERDRQEASDLLEKYKADLAGARDEAARIVDDANRTAASIRREATEQAREEAERIVVSAQQTIAAERVQTLFALRREVGSLAVDLAERIVSHQLDNDARQQQLVDDFIAGLEAGTDVAAGEATAGAGA